MSFLSRKEKKALKQWLKNFGVFVIIPVALAFFGALQTGVDVKVAWGVALGAAYGTIVDFLRKVKASQ